MTTELKNVYEFFWRGAALARRREEVARKSERAFVLAQRAESTARIASLALSAEPHDPASEGIACELYRQSAFWAACALSDARKGATGTSYDPSVWDELDERARSIVRSLIDASFVNLQELSAGEKNEARVSLQKLARDLLDKFGGRHTVRAIYRQRSRRLFALLGGVVVAVLIGFWLKDMRERSRELADGKSWRASSNYGGGCESPRQVCKGNSGYFFHTQPDDENPWVEFDLVTTQPVTRVEVENRKDCCFERASPLLIEVSVDRHTWTEVARHEGEFAHWRATFPPAAARWVRLRVPTTTALHLNRVRVFP